MGREMDEPDDITLLRQYTEQDSEAAFATLVSRHVHSVFSSAYRQTGDRHQAEEITQVVFVLLARKAHRLTQHEVISGWLHKTARLTAVTWIRSEIRRARREQETVMQTEREQGDTETWVRIAPLLDAAIADLAERDRLTIVLRYFDGRSMKEIAGVLNTTEDAAKMRHHRAMEKLRRFFGRRGVALSAGLLTSAMASHSVQAAPAGLVDAVTSAVGKGAPEGASTSTLTRSVMAEMVWNQIRIPVAGVAGLFVLGTTAAMLYFHLHPGLFLEWHRRLMP